MLFTTHDIVVQRFMDKTRSTSERPPCGTHEDSGEETTPVQTISRQSIARGRRGGTSQYREHEQTHLFLSLLVHRQKEFSCRANKILQVLQFEASPFPRIVVMQQPICALNERLYGFQVVLRWCAERARLVAIRSMPPSRDEQARLPARIWEGCVKRYRMCQADSEVETRTDSLNGISSSFLSSVGAVLRTRRK